MKKTVTLDAMIERSDFAKIENGNSSIDLIKTISVEQLTQQGFLIPLLRKPDFQRETNQWSPDQVVSFLESYLNNELIPSIILWNSTSQIFVIDGGHRLSALRAWINDDYGDGFISIPFFSNNITTEQKKIANKTRELVENRVGKHDVLKSALINPNEYSNEIVDRARNMARRQLDLQWVNGDADKAESSFFKINTQGTPLDSTEEKLLRHRERSISIAARSIVRAATGHNYWSKFGDDNRQKIVEKAKQLHEILFNPELNTPIRTLDLPIGGAQSPIVALELLIEILEISTAPQNSNRKIIEDFMEDKDGDMTIKLLDECIGVLSWLNGKSNNSLGLHPAIYYYSHRGRHIRDLLTGIILLIRRKTLNNDKSFFKKFTEVRNKIEEILISKKEIIMQALQSIRSAQRYERVAELIDFLVIELSKEKQILDDEIIKIIAPNTDIKLILQSNSTSGGQFSDETKSKIFLNQALKSSMKCPICNGYMEVNRSFSYDHILPLRDGGNGKEENGQLVHPYCNSGFKN